MCQEKNSTYDRSKLMKMQTQTAMYTSKQCFDWIYTEFFGLEVVIHGEW